MVRSLHLEPQRPRPAHISYCILCNFASTLKTAASQRIVSLCHQAMGDAHLTMQSGLLDGDESDPAVLAASRTGAECTRRWPACCLAQQQAPGSWCPTPSAAAANQRTGHEAAEEGHSARGLLHGVDVALQLLQEGRRVVVRCVLDVPEPRPLDLGARSPSPQPLL